MHSPDKGQWLVPWYSKGSVQPRVALNPLVIECQKLLFLGKGQAEGCPFLWLLLILYAFACDFERAVLKPGHQLVLRQGGTANGSGTPVENFTLLLAALLAS